MVKVVGQDKHDKRKRRGWRKFQLRSSNRFIVANLLSEYQKTDGEIAPNLIHQVGRIDSMTADKAYDQVYMKPQMINSKRVVKSISILG